LSGRSNHYIFLLVLISLVGFLMYTYYHSANEPKILSYSEFQKEATAGKIKDVTIAGQELEGNYTDAGRGKFKTRLPFEPRQEFTAWLSEHNVAVKAEDKDRTTLWILAVNLLPYLLLIGLIWLIFRAQSQAGGGQAFSFGRSKAKLINENRVKVTFNDVAGVDEAKEELSEVVDFLKFPKKYQALGARIPKGVLLLGAPGTGKTLLGRAVAGEAGVPFYYISGSDFVEMFVGVGASRVRDLFEQAKKNSPCIVFVDEIDAVGRQRGAGLGGGHDEREQTLNQLLVEMDGFEPNLGIIILAATNRPDVLDPALLRPGRFDRQIVVDKPDIAGRKGILEVHSRNKPLDTEVDLDVLARRTPGFSGADLENLLNEAALLAARVGEPAIMMPHCEEAIDRVLMGPERKSRIISEKEKLVTAYHEAGHALVARMLPDANPVRKVSVLPRGMALGVTWQLPEEDRYLKTRQELMAEIAVAMGGRVAEELQFGEITTGAASDIKQASELARDMVCRYGMSEKLGPLTYGKKHHQVFLGRDIMEDRNYSDSVASQIDDEVHTFVDMAYKTAREILEANREKLDRLVKVLRDREVIEGADIDEIMEGRDPKAAAPEIDAKDDSAPVQAPVPSTPPGTQGGKAPPLCPEGA